MSPRTIFISYNHEDRAHAERLVSQLVLNGVEVWWDEWSVLVGDSIYTRVCEGISASRYLAVLLTANSLQSRWVQEELDLAKVRELESRSVIILPLRFDATPLPLSLRTKRYADFTNFETGFRQLMSTVAPNLPSVFVDNNEWTTFRQFLLTMAEPVGKGPMSLIAPQPGPEADTVVESQVHAQLLSPAVFALRSAESISTEAKGESRALIHVEFRSARTRLPIAVSLRETCHEVVERLAKALLLPSTFAEARTRYLLLHDNRPLEMSATLEEEGVSDGATLNLGVLTFLIE
jgi:hypothetical protein